MEHFLILFDSYSFIKDASAEDLKAQKKEMEDIVQPIIAKLYQGQGGAPPAGGEEDEDYDKDESPTGTMAYFNKPFQSKQLLPIPDR